MVPSKQNRSCLLSAPRVFLLLLLHTFHTKGVGGANFTIVNECSETIWAVVEDSTSGGGGFSNCVFNGSVSCNSSQSQTTTTTRYRFQVGPSRSAAFHKQSGWNGRVWGRTGCDSNANSCSTGDAADATRAEFGLGPSKFDRLDYYDVSLVDGYNLGMVVDPSGGSGPCRSAGCAEDLNERCPPELSTGGGAACRGPCAVFRTQEYCCTEEQQPCGPTNYSLLFKKLCPRTSTYPKDDTAATTLFSCTAAHYSVIFCPSSASLLEEISPAPAQSFDGNPQERRAPSPGRSNNRQRKREINRATEIITIVSVSIGCVIIVTIAICIFLRRRQQSQNRKSNQDVENLLLQHRDLAPKRYRYSQIKKMTKSLSDKLGRGGFGCVYKGTLPDGRLVAVKILSEILDSNGEEFVNEVASISRTSHVNIVTLLGFCYEGNNRALVYEYMPNKSLDKFLGNNGDSFLDLNKLYEIAVGIARGLEYLHTGCTTRIVHFDIKPQNILLDEDFCPKISDFGLAKLCKKKQSVLSVQGMRGTTGYIAPEVFSRHYGGVSHKSDVYSYGMMLLDMAGAKKDGGTVVVTQSSENYFPDKVYEQVIIDATNNLDGESMMIEEEEEKRRKMMLIGFWCIQTIPSERPSISKVVEMLEGNLDSIQIPPKPFLFSTVIPNPNQETSSPFSANVETENTAGD